MTQRYKLFVFASIIVILLGLFIARSTALSCWDFRNELWGPAYLLTHGQSPYRIDQLFPLGNAVWMPMIVGALFPFGFLPLQQASNLWFVLNVIGFLLMIWISTGSRFPPIILFAIALLLSFLFPPLVTHLWLGQISILITLIFLIIGMWNDEMPVILLALLMAVSLAKPQLAFLIMPGFIFYRLKKYGFQKTAQLILYLIGWSLVLSLPLFLADVGWFHDFIHALQENRHAWAHPSSLYVLRNAIPQIGTFLWVLLTTLVFIINIWLWSSRPSQVAIYWSLALTPLMTPYVWTWDFVMLLPLFISELFKAKTKVSQAILLGGYIVCWGLITNLKMHDEVNDSLFWWIPWLLLGIVLISEIPNFHLKLLGEHTPSPG